jgi:hypothetical protein
VVVELDNEEGLVNIVLDDEVNGKNNELTFKSRGRGRSGGWWSRAERRRDLFGVSRLFIGDTPKFQFDTVAFLGYLSEGN